MTDELPNPDHTKDAAVQTIRDIYEDLPDPADFRAGIEALRARPETKGEYAQAMEYLHVDVSIAMAAVDDVMEYTQKGDKTGKLGAMLVFTRYLRTLDQDRMMMLTYRLAQMVWAELVEKVGGDREVLLQKIAEDGADVFAKLPDGDVL